MLRACEKIPSRLWVPLNISDCIAGPSISGHVELATLPAIGTPAPCQTRPEAPSLRAGIFSQALRSIALEVSIPSLHFSSVGEVIAQRLGFTRNLLKKHNTGWGSINLLYISAGGGKVRDAFFKNVKGKGWPLSSVPGPCKLSCGFKDQGRVSPSGEKCGLAWKELQKYL